MIKKNTKIGTKVTQNMGVKRTGVITKPFHWKESNDGTYRAPDKNDVPVQWDDDTKGYDNIKYLDIVTESKMKKSKLQKVIKEIANQILTNPVNSICAKCELPLNSCPHGEQMNERKSNAARKFEQDNAVKFNKKCKLCEMPNNTCVCEKVNNIFENVIKKLNESHSSNRNLEIKDIIEDLQFHGISKDRIIKICTKKFKTSEKEINDIINDDTVINEIKKSIKEDQKFYNFFKQELKKAGYSKLKNMPKEKKKDFFNKIDADWKGKKEITESKTKNFTKLKGK